MARKASQTPAAAISAPTIPSSYQTSNSERARRLRRQDSSVHAPRHRLETVADQQARLVVQEGVVRHAELG